MPRLTDWYFTKGIVKPTHEERFIAEGFVLSHPKIQDGIHIHTSIIEKIDMDAENNRLLIQTHSQNIYELMIADIKVDRFENIQECLQCFDVSTLSLGDYQKIKEESESVFIRNIAEVLEKNELYLQLSGVSAQKAFFKNNTDEVRKIDVSTHVSILQDSYLIIDREKGEMDFRYWGGLSSIEPYHWSDGLNAVAIENIGANNIKVVGSSMETICNAGEITRIRSAEYCGEGLLSPDVVNGKCVLI